MRRRSSLACVVLAGLLAAPAHAAPGDLDPTFGTGGRVLQPTAPRSTAASSLALTPDGRIAAAGHATDGHGYDFALSLRGVDGTPAAGFGVDGMVRTAMGTGHAAAATTVLAQPDGRLVVVGTSDFVDAGIAPAGDFALARYRPDGSLDPSFGSGGRVVTPFPGLAAAQAAIAQPADRTIVVAGTTDTGDGRWSFALARYLSSGLPDLGFGERGRVVTSIAPAVGLDYALALVALPDGRIVAGGSVNDGTRRGFALVRYTATGAVDRSFGEDGVAFTPLPAGRAILRGLAPAPGGRLVAVGASPDGRATGFSLVRYLANGDLDPSFGDDGIVVTSLAGPPTIPQVDAARANGAVVLPSGEILVAGHVQEGLRYAMAVAAFRPNGTLDPAFGTGGVRSIPWPGSFAAANAIAVDAIGRIVVAGYADDGWGRTGIALARLQGSASQAPRAPAADPDRGAVSQRPPGVARSDSTASARRHAGPRRRACTRRKLRPRAGAHLLTSPRRSRVRRRRVRCKGAVSMTDRLAPRRRGRQQRPARRRGTLLGRR